MWEVLHIKPTIQRSRKVNFRFRNSDRVKYYLWKSNYSELRSHVKYPSITQSKNHLNSPKTTELAPIVLISIGKEWKAKVDGQHSFFFEMFRWDSHALPWRKEGVWHEKRKITLNLEIPKIENAYINRTGKSLQFLILKILTQN